MPDNKAVKPHAPTWRFGTEEQRPEISRKGTPGPGAYKRPASCGSQMDSSRQSYPAFSFGTFKGPPASNELETVKIMKDDKSPGPGSYKSPSGLRVQATSHRRSAPAASIGGREKFGSLLSNESVGTGPAAFAFANKNPLQLITQPQSPICRFGTSQRKESYIKTPGPGNYPVADMNYTRSRAPTYSMGSGPQRLPVAYRRAEQNGPGRCRSDHAVGKQIKSNQRSAPSHSFGSRTKYRSKNETDMSNPGPGAYG